MVQRRYYENNRFNGIRIAPLSLYAIIKEVPGIERFQLIQICNDRLELRLLAADKQKVFAEAKQAIESYLGQNGVTVEVGLSEKSPEANPISGKFKHIFSLLQNQYYITFIKEPDAELYEYSRKWL